jgi:hypothetical protein
MTLVADTRTARSYTRDCLTPPYPHPVTGQVHLAQRSSRLRSGAEQDHLHQRQFLPIQPGNRVNITNSRTSDLEKPIGDQYYKSTKRYNLAQWLKYVLMFHLYPGLPATSDSLADSLLLVGKWIYGSTRPRGFD